MGEETYQLSHRNKVCQVDYVHLDATGFCNSKYSQGRLPDEHNQLDRLYLSWGGQSEEMPELMTINIMFQI